MWEVIKQQHSKRNNNMDKITDMCDGDIMRLDSFFNVPENAGVMLCTDGVPVFKSSGMLHVYYFFTTQIYITYFQAC